MRLDVWCGRVGRPRCGSIVRHPLGESVGRGAARLYGTPRHLDKVSVRRAPAVRERFAVVRRAPAGRERFAVVLVRAPSS